MAVVTELPAEHDGSAAPPPGRGVSPVDGAIAGAVAAGLALAVSEVVCGIAGSQPSLITAVGTEFIDRFAGALKDLAIALFGTNDKVALVTGIVVVSVALGAVLGKASVRRPVVGVIGFAAFGLVGLFSYLGDPLSEPGVGVVAAVVAAAIGLATLFGLLALLRLGHGAGAPPVAPTSSRRLFLVSAGSLAVLAAGAAVLGRRLGRSDVVESVRAATDLPTSVTQVPAPLPLPAPAGEIPDVPGLSTFITPNADFYRIDTALVVPQVDVAGWRLRVEGEVDSPFELTFDELVAMSDFSDTVTLQCVSNEVGGNLVGNATWQGVRLATLLERAGVRPSGTQVVGHSVDDFTAGFPTAVGLDGRTAMVAVAMNGEPLPAEHGFPARLVVAGLYGYVSATKWLDRITLVPWEEFDGYWVPRGWSKEGPIKVASRIDVPRSGATVDPGAQAIAGVAWQPTLGIGRVEVQVDEGPWTDATLGDVTTGNTWVQWYLPWDAPSGEHRIRVRATSTAGETQTEDRADPAPNGSTGWHSRTVKVR